MCTIFLPLIVASTGRGGLKCRRPFFVHTVNSI
jgi:hypothetical protein